MNKLDGGQDIYYRPITLDDYNSFYNGYKEPKTIRGISFIKDDEVVGVAGLRYDGILFTVFSDVKDDIIVPKQTIWRAIKVVMNMVSNMKCDVYAIPSDCLETSRPLLKRLGFKDVGEMYKRSYIE